MIKVDPAAHDQLIALLPEIQEIRNSELREKVVGCWLEALKEGGWGPRDLLRLPASLRLVDRPLRLLHHIRGVAQLTLATFRMYEVIYGSSAPLLDHDVLLAGALLHDVGKPVEFAESSDTWRLSDQGQFYKHPFSGFAIASRWNLPKAVLEVIAYHSTEGDGFPRSVENSVVNLVDALNFTPFFAPAKTKRKAEIT